MILSADQKKAINPTLSCWVEASAGTGKTKVLTDRVISLLLAGVRVEEILCLTFTKAAGAEMATRIRSYLLRWTVLTDGELSEALLPFLGKTSTDQRTFARSLFYNVLKSPNGIRIQTIHGFCQFLLRSFPLEAGLLPHFQIADDLKQKEIKKEASLSFWGQLSKAQQAFLIETLTPFQLEDFIDFVLNQRDDFIDPQKAKSALCSFLKWKEGEASLSIFVEKINTFFSFEITLPNRLTVQDEKLLNVLEKIRDPSAKSENLYGAYKDVFLTKTGEVRKKIISADMGKKNPPLSSILEEELQRLIGFEKAYAHDRVWQASSMLIDIGKIYIDTYQALKHERGVIDFDDLIDYSAQLLKKSDIKPWVFEKLDYHFQHVLVDEAQDTSEGQWQLLFHLIEEFFETKTTNQRTLFVVGDPKQSIYSFQGASPKGFGTAASLFKSLGNGQHVTLSESYRSVPEVLEIVNKLFSASEKMGVGSALHKAFRKQDKGSVTLWPIEEETISDLSRSPWAPSDSQTFEYSPRRKVAEKIADQIQVWLKSKTRLKSRKRPIQPKDIMILVRRRDQFMEDIIKALKTRSIPVSGADRLKLCDHIMVQDILSLIDVLCQEADDLSLASVLKSPFFNVSEARLQELCINREESLWEVLVDTEPQIHTVLKTLQEILKTSETVEGFFYHLLKTKGYEKNFHERFGVEVDDILSGLLDASAAFEEENGPHIISFVAWLRLQEIEIKRSHDGAQENEVRLMTIHAAKGLEAPIVFLPDTTQTPTHQSSFYKKTGYPFLLWADREARKASEIVDSFCAADHTLEEYYRLLYVALTRAEDHLFIGGWGAKRSLSPRSWYEALRPVMEQLGTTENDLLIYGDAPSENDGDTESANIPKSEEVRLPAWINVPLKLETPKTVSPSKIAETANEVAGSTIRKDQGILIHQILEHVVGRDVSLEKIRTAIHRLNVAPEAESFIYKSVCTVLSYPIISLGDNKKIKTEIGIEGDLNGQHIRGVIDLLIEDKNNQTIWILDYKTGAFVEAYRSFPPIAYVQQMKTYKKLMEHIYPTMEIKTGLIWTEIGWLQLLS